jgi:hypothetical protein
MTRVRKVLILCAVAVAVTAGAAAPALADHHAAAKTVVDKPADIWPRSPGSA